MHRTSLLQVILPYSCFIRIFITFAQTGPDTLLPINITHSPPSACFSTTATLAP